MTRKSGSTLISAVFVFAAAASGQVLADGAVMVKGGVVKLADDTQIVDGYNTVHDDTSNRTFSVSFEHRSRRNGMGFGVEYSNYQHDFTNSLGDNGETETHILQFVARKYFFYKSLVRPFVGLGVGWGVTHAEYRQSGFTYDDYTGAFVLQANGGVEFKIDNFSLMIEAKRFWHEPGSSNDYNATATAVLGGIGFNW